MQSKIEKKHKNVARYKYEKEIACVASVSIGLSIRWRHFSLFGCAKIGPNATLMEAVGRGRGGEKRKRLPTNPMILKNAPLTLSKLDKFIV